ncbi:nitroreductase family protein [Flavisolibacter nicotianae]|uniref:nitroreductase family protein n=1 Tax=Flavisolibacter nicotianae TaxID=2364882 RepID=UPI000EAC097F|nr:nitroreductase family protein [Flavisolibacter nicotianae]
MELLDALQWRYASKKMNGQAVPEEKVERILEAIRLAPSSMGLQPYTVLVIKDAELKKQILPVANNQQQVVDASHLLVFAAWDNITPEHVADYISLMAETRNIPVESLDQFKAALLRIAGRSAEENFQWTARQSYIAFATAIAAAAEEHVDATPMEGFNSAALDELLGLKEKGLRSITLLPLGYRDEENDWLAKSPKVRREKDKLFVIS